MEKFPTRSPLVRVFKIVLTIICIKWVLRDPRTIFLGTSFTQKMPEGSDLPEVD